MTIFYYWKYYSLGIVVFLVSNAHIDSELLTDYYNDHWDPGLFSCYTLLYNFVERCCISWLAIGCSHCSVLYIVTHILSQYYNLKRDWIHWSQKTTIYWMRKLTLLTTQATTAGYESVLLHNKSLKLRTFISATFFLVAKIIFRYQNWVHQKYL